MFTAGSVQEVAERIKLKGKALNCKTKHVHVFRTNCPIREMLRPDPVVFFFQLEMTSE